jgi:hypothetical protein
LSENIIFRVRIADIVFEVRCLCASTRQRCSAYLTDDEPDHIIIIDRAQLEAERSLLLNLQEPVGDPESFTPQALESLRLCRCLADKLPECDRILFHGSCLALDGRGVLFTAKSGTGKSTHTRLWREVFGSRVEMLNDDKPFLRVTPQGVTAYGTPWQGKHNLGRNTAVPLHGICVLCRGEENRIEPITPREALPMLLQQTFTPEDPQAMVRTLALVQQLSKTVGLYRLYCNMDPQAAMVARDGIFSQEETL